MALGLLKTLILKINEGYSSSRAHPREPRNDACIKPDVVCIEIRDSAKPQTPLQVLRIHRELS
jgi:hypothetical protein